MDANICRTCTEHSSAKLVPIFSKLEDQFIANVIVHCCSITISEDDGLPTSVCAECLSSVRVIVRFAQKVRESDRKLRQLLKEEVPAVNPDELFPEVKIELVKGEQDDQVEQQNADKSDAADSGSDFENDADDSDWKGEEKDSEDEPPPERTKRKASLSSKVKKEAVKTKRLKKSKKKTKTTEHDQDADEDVLDEAEEEMFKLVQIDSSRLVCCLCYADFATEDEMKQHGKKVHTKKIQQRSSVGKEFECDFCCQRYCTKDALLHHKEMAAKLVLKKIYECKTCQARFFHARRKRNHVRSHLNLRKIPEATESVVKPFTICCMKNCAQNFETEEDLLDHGQKNHAENKNLEKPPGKSIECPVCFKFFETPKGLIRHRRRMFHPTLMQCSICGKEFKSKNALVTHERKHLNDKPFACELCEKRFLTQYALTCHMLVHKDDKPFVCTVCGSGFKRENNLRNHMLSHTDELPFKCEVCGKGFKGKYYLQYHMRTHTGHKPFPCHYCDLSFARHSNRTRHERVHTGIKPFKCAYCDRTFIRRQRYLDHESTHTGVKPYRCEICNSMFSQKTTLKKHMETHPLAADNQLALGQSSSTMPAESSMSPMSLPPQPPSSQLQLPMMHSSIFNQ